MHKVHAFSEDMLSRSQARKLPHELKKNTITKNNRFWTVLPMEAEHAT